MDPSALSVMDGHGSQSETQKTDYISQSVEQKSTECSQDRFFFSRMINLVLASRAALHGGIEFWVLAKSHNLYLLLVTN